MTSSKRFYKSTTKVSLGDLDTPFDAYCRKQNAPLHNKFRLNLELVAGNIWGMFNQVRGIPLFDDCNQQVGVATDIITCMFDTNYSNYKYLEVNGRLLEVLSVQGLSRRDNFFMTLYCCEKGSKDSKVSIL